MKNLKITFTTILAALGCFVSLPQMGAVSPAPDGCYPNSTTAEGCKALHSLTTGAGNTAVGWYSLFATTTGSSNTAVGAGALDLNTADNNTAVGVAALLLNTTGTNNTANGAGALVFNDTGEGNTATGAFALYSNTNGQFNTANGEFTLYFNTIGERNTAIGDSALYNNTGGDRNTAVGNPALLNNTTGDDNTAVGAFALDSNTGTAERNTAIGASALPLNTGGIRNTAVGAFALQNSATGDHNIGLGHAAGFQVTTASDVICIGTGGQNVDNSCYIGQIFGATSSGGTAVFINNDGRLGTLTSSLRFKEEIQPMKQASDTLFALKPVTFRYREEIDPAGTSQFGLVAEDVEKVNPDLIVRDKEGKPYSVRYDQVNAMLLNEFLKEHKKVQDLESRLAQQEHQIECLSAGLQKVNAQLEMSRPAPQVATNGQ
jgi:hypothetical protein